MLSCRLEFRVHLHVQSGEFTLDYFPIILLWNSIKMFYKHIYVILYSNKCHFYVNFHDLDKFVQSSLFALSLDEKHTVYKKHKSRNFR